MNETSTISPASVISRATSPMRRMFSTRSASREAEVLVEAVAHVVAVEHVGVAAEPVQLGLDEVGDRRLAGAREAGEPQHARRLALLRRPQRLVDVDRLPAHVGRAPQRVAQHPRADRVVGDAVDEDERARLAVVVVGVEGDRAVELEVADPDLVELELGRGEVLARVDVELVLERRDRRGGDLRADPHQVVAPAVHRVVGHPHHRRLELVGDAGRRVGGREHVAAAGVDLVGERERDGLAGDGGVEVAVVGHDPLDPCCACRAAARGSRRRGAPCRRRSCRRSRGSPSSAGSPTGRASGTARPPCGRGRPRPPRGSAAASARRTTACARSARPRCRPRAPRPGCRSRRAGRSPRRTPGRRPRSRGSAPRSARRGPSC